MWLEQSNGVTPETWAVVESIGICAGREPGFEKGEASDMISSCVLKDLCAVGDSLGTKVEAGRSVNRLFFFLFFNKLANREECCLGPGWQQWFNLGFIFFFLEFEIERTV